MQNIVYLGETRASEEPVYVISIAARMVNLHPQTLRAYELMGLVKPARTAGNIRLYSEVDIERLRQITRLIDDLGVNLAGVEVILHMREQMMQMKREMDQLQREYEGEIDNLRRQLQVARAKNS